MRATDFRIGNLINYKIIDEFDKRKQWFEISEIDYDDLRILQIKDEINQDYQPIILTEEWLQKLGFEMKGFYRLKVTSFLELCWKPHDKTLNIQTEKNGFTEDSKVKYVHELQNLYYALTKKELKIKK
jgi:hypothetical protein